MAKKKHDASYDKPVPRKSDSGLDLEERLERICKEVHELHESGARNADWYYISCLLNLGLKNVKARKSN